jgi:hypothetical protein
MTTIEDHVRQADRHREPDGLAEPTQEHQTQTADQERRDEDGPSGTCGPRTGFEDVLRRVGGRQRDRDHEVGHREAEEREYEDLADPTEPAPAHGEAPDELDRPRPSNEWRATNA